MADSSDKFCTICDPSPVKAVEWCSECQDFLCLECLKYHKAAKCFKTHSTISVDNYNKLPEFVKDLEFNCEEHEEKFESYCPVHSSPCCIRCALTTHKTCKGLAPLRDFIISCKSSPSMLDIDQTLKELTSYIQKVTDEKRKNKKDIIEQKKKIPEEINVFRKSLNDYLDRLEKELVETIDSKTNAVCQDIDSIVNEFDKAATRVQDISRNCATIKEHGTDLQTFLCLALLTSSVSNEENCVKKWNTDEKVINKETMINMNLKEFTKIKYIGELHMKNVNSEIMYTPQKEKQAQIMNLGTVKQINLKLKKLFQAKVVKHGSCITGCSFVGNENIILSEYNSKDYVDRVTLYNLDGKFLRCVFNGSASKDSLYDVTTIDVTTFAVAANMWIKVIDLISQDIKLEIRTQGNGSGIICNGDEIIFCQKNNIGKYCIRIKKPELIFKIENRRFSYLVCEDNYLYFTNETHTIYCLDLTTRKIVWQFEDTTIISQARGVAVDKRGRIIVAGQGSNNLIEISSDGKHAQEILTVQSPRAMCYDKNKDQLVVCTTANDVYVYDICG